MRTPKIAILGLDNAGKTTIYKKLENYFGDVSDVLPTKGIERHTLKFLGQQIYCWDHGGQSHYRDQYLARASYYLAEIDYIYFVIDVQDLLRIQLAKEYLKKIIQAIQENEEPVHLTYFLHKADPELLETPKIQANIAKSLQVIKDVNQKFNIPAKYYYTSIHQPFSIITAFTHPVVNYEGINRSISYTLQSFAREWGLDFIILLTESMMDLGHYFSDEIDRAEVEISILQTTEKFKDEPEISKDVKIPFYDLWCNFSKFKVPNPTKYQILYFIWGSTKDNHITEVITEHASNLRDNIQELLSNTEIPDLII